MDFIKVIEEGYRRDIADFNVGDTVRVYSKVVEGDKERLQPYEGAVISKKGGGTGATFIVRKVSSGIGVERIFPLHSPSIERVEVIRRGSVRRAKLYYLRDKKGKAAKIKEKDRTSK
jgi:large subunit ribosomal protein L19